MSGISANRYKKNNKKNKHLDTSESLQVKSLSKFDTTKTFKETKRNNTKSEYDVRKSRKIPGGKDKLYENERNGDVTELETSVVEKIEKLSLLKKSQNECCGHNCSASSSTGLKQAESLDDLFGDTKRNFETSLEGEEPFLPEYYSGELCTSGSSNAYSYNYYAKNTKSIKFTNQVTVLYFNGEDVLFESMEPLKKEVDQQLRNKEMRKEHLLKGQESANVYLF